MSQQIKLEISERWKVLRTRRGWTQEKLAELLGISRNYVHLIEAGAKTPGKSLLTLFESFESGVGAKLETKTAEDQQNLTTLLRTLQVTQLQEYQDYLTQQSREVDDPEQQHRLQRLVRLFVEEQERRSALSSISLSSMEEKAFSSAGAAKRLSQELLPKPKAGETSEHKPSPKPGAPPRPK